MATYNNLVSAKAITGVTVTQPLLDEAQSIIHLYTSYRWAATTKTLTLSKRTLLDADNVIDTSAPIISVTSLTIDDTALTDGTDFEVAKAEGEIFVLSGINLDVNNIVLIYIYGFVTGDGFFNDTIQVVRGAEARIAAYLKRNPVMLGTLGVSGASLGFNKNQLKTLLSPVPKPYDFQGVW